MRFIVLGSGSKGNSAIVECGGLRLMIDAGLNAKQLKLRLQHAGIDPTTLSGVLLTHEHGDHTAGLKIFLKHFPLAIYTTASTARIVRESGVIAASWQLFEAGQVFQIGSVNVESFAIQHDAVDPVGFVVGDGRHRLGFLSDAGHITRSVTERLRGLHGLVVEANYDEGLLEADLKRPWSIKQRISSRHGHLSNTQVTELIREIAHPELAQVVLGHLSSDCNEPSLILSALKNCLAELGHPQVDLICAGQDTPCGWFDLQKITPAEALI